MLYGGHTTVENPAGTLPGVTGLRDEADTTCVLTSYQHELVTCVISTKAVLVPFPLPLGKREDHEETLPQPQGRLWGHLETHETREFLSTHTWAKHSRTHSPGGSRLLGL